MRVSLSVLVMALLTAGSTKASTPTWDLLETNARQIIPAFTVNPILNLLKFRLTAGSDHPQRRCDSDHCYRIPALCRCRAISDNFDAIQNEYSVKRRDFVASAFCALALLPMAVSATEFAVTPDVRDIDPELLRALVNVLRARGGMIFLLERLRTNKASWRICETLPGMSYVLPRHRQTRISVYHFFCFKENAMNQC